MKSLRLLHSNMQCGNVPMAVVRSLQKGFVAMLAAKSFASVHQSLSGKVATDEQLAGSRLRAQRDRSIDRTGSNHGTCLLLWTASLLTSGAVAA